MLARMPLALLYLGVGPGVPRSRRLEPGDTFVLPPEGLVMGRSGDNQIPLRVGWVSRRHCKVVPTGERSARVEDDSTNGTWVAGRRVYPQHPRTMRVGDILIASRLDGVSGFAFELIEAEPSSP